MRRLAVTSNTIAEGSTHLAAVSHLSEAIISQSVRAQRSEGTQHCCGSDLRSLLVHLHGIIIRKHPQMQTGNKLVFCFCFFFPPKGYLIAHISDCRSISSSSLHWVRPTFVSHHHVIGNPVLLTCGSNYRVTHKVEGFLPKKKNDSDLLFFSRVSVLICNSVTVF